MPDYAEGKIYKIFCSTTDDTYIGSSTQPLCNRMKNHRNDHNNKNKAHYNFKLYQCFRERGVDNFYIELLEKYPCSSKEELVAREGYWIRQDKPTLNTRIAGRTDKQYYEDNKEAIKQKVKEYCENNRDAVLERKRSYHQRLKDTPEYKQKRQEYAETHKQQIAEYKKRWAEENKERINSCRNEKVQCECGCVVSRKYMLVHRKSRKHEQLTNC